MDKTIIIKKRSLKKRGNCYKTPREVCEVDKVQNKLSRRPVQVLYYNSTSFLDLLLKKEKINRKKNLLRLCSLIATVYTRHLTLGRAT